MSSPDDLKRWADDVFREGTALDTLKRIVVSFEQNPTVSTAQLGATAEYCIHVALKGMDFLSLEEKGMFIQAFLVNLNTITAEHHIYLFPFLSDKMTIGAEASPVEVDATQARPVPPPQKERDS